MFAFGSGVGSSGFYDAENVDLSQWGGILRSFEAIGVRGPRSAASLRSIGIDRVSIIGDPALSLGPSALPGLSQRTRIAVNLTVDRNGRYGEGPYECFSAVARICRESRESGYEIVAIALGEGDEKPLRDLLRESGMPDAAIQRAATVDEFCGMVEGSACLIGVRLHSAVLACACGTVPILISYRDKCLDFMESIGLGDLAIPLAPGAEARLLPAFQAVMSNQQMRVEMFRQVQVWRDRQKKFGEDLVGCLAKLNVVEERIQRQVEAL